MKNSMYKTSDVDLHFCLYSFTSLIGIYHVILIVTKDEFKKKL